MLQDLTDSLITFNEQNMIPLLVSYQMMPQFWREYIIDTAIESIECSSTEVAKAYQKFYQSYQITTEEELQAWLKYYRITPTQLELAATRPVKIEKFKQQTWGNQLNKYFYQRKSQLGLVIYSLIRVEDSDIAEELFFRIDEGEQTFAEVARKYSQGPEAFTGGIIGPQEIGNLPQGLAQILRSIQPRQLLRPLSFEKCFVILRLEKLIPATLDEVTSQRLLDELFEVWLQQQINIFNQEFESERQLSLT